MVTPGFWTILNGSVRVSIAAGMPCGRHASLGAPTPSAFWRVSHRAFAHGWNGAPPGRSAAMLYRYLERTRRSVGMTVSPTTSQTPERSGFPSAARGAGAVRLGRPSGNRGVPGVLYDSHWADTGTARIRAATSTIRPIRHARAPAGEQHPPMTLRV